MTIGIDGMVSGLDTTAIIDGLVAIQANQQVLLKRKSSAASELVTALQALNTRVAALATAAGKAADPASWAVSKASSSSESVAVSASSTAKPGTVELSVTQLAARQVSLVDAAALASGFSIRIGGDDSEPFTFTEPGEHIDDIAAAINKRSDETGISATKLRTGTDNGNPTYSLQLSGKTGEANAFTIGADVPVTTRELATAQDAMIRLWPSAGTGTGTENDITITSATNTFTDVLDGVDLTVNRVDTDPVTVTIGSDTAAQKKLAVNLVGDLGVVLSEIGSRTRTTTGADGNVKGGLLSGDSAVRFLANDLRAAMTNQVDGHSPSSIGISMDRYGAVSLNESTFADALAEDPAATMAALQSIAGRVSEIASAASAPNEGTITRKITSQESLVKDIGEQISRWDTRLEARRNQLIAQFSAMEVRLSQLQSTQSWLTNQIAGLNAGRE